MNEKIPEIVAGPKNQSPGIPGTPPAVEFFEVPAIPANLGNHLFLYPGCVDSLESARRVKEKGKETAKENTENTTKKRSSSTKKSKLRYEKEAKEVQYHYKFGPNEKRVPLQITVPLP